jgi:biofilm PGA synthesis N-glycosyltransferase PgaC
VTATIFWLSLAGLVIIWIGYPVAMIILAGLKRRGPAPESAISIPPRVSLIIASRESRSEITARVEDAVQHRRPDLPFEIVVGLDVRGGEAPDRFGALEPGVRFVRGDEPGGKACALNAAVRSATGEVLVFTDTFQRFDADTIDRLIKALEDRRFGAVSGALHLPEGTGSGRLLRAYWTLERSLRTAEAVIHSAIGLSGSVSAIRREAWIPLPSGLILDDLYLPMRMVLDGWRIGFEPAAVAHERRPPDPAKEYLRKTRTLTGVLQLCVWLPGVLNPAKNPVWAQFVLHKLARFLTPFLLVTTAVSAALQVQSRFAPWQRIVFLGVLLVPLAMPGRVGAALRGTVRLGFLLQWATLKALWNARDGRWEVWTR